MMTMSHMINPNLTSMPVSMVRSAHPVQSKDPAHFRLLVHHSPLQCHMLDLSSTWLLWWHSIPGLLSGRPHLSMWPMWQHSIPGLLYHSLSGSYHQLSGSYHSLFGSYHSLSGSYHSPSGSYHSLSGSYHQLSGS